MADITAYRGQTLNIDVNQLVNNSSNGDWSISNSLTHNNKIGSYSDKQIDSLIEGDTYRITYTITGYGRCNIRMYLGNTAGTVRTSNGTYTETLQYTGNIKRLRFWSNGVASISYCKVEHLTKNISESILDTIENKSWTLSYDPILKQWISFHSYLPNNYIQHPDKLLAKANDSNIKLINSGDFGKYFSNNIKPFIIETVFNDYPTETKVYDSIHANIETKVNEVTTNKFFDKTILYNEYQCTGEIVLDTTNLTKKERNWSFNKFNDITNNLSQSIFVKDWNSIKSQFPIDKVVNINKLDNNKDWFKKGRMRDKYLAVRFIENNFDNNKFIVKFVLSFFRASQR